MSPVIIIDVLSLFTFSLLYFWTFYNIPTLFSGLKSHHRKEKRTPKREIKNLPTFSVIVAAKNEENVIKRLLKRLVSLSYPKEKTEIIIVEDGSTDRTEEICRKFVEGSDHPNIRFFHRNVSEGKPAALNHALHYATGEIICIFDADNIPDKDILHMAAGHFSNKEVAAIQGLTKSLNTGENLLTKIISLEEAAWFRPYMRGKESLKLFIPLTGSCGFIRREVFQDIGNWNATSIAEDVELAARMTQKKYVIRYANDIISWQEYPSKIKELVKQRTRWFQGYMETAARYGVLLLHPSKKNIDAEITLIGPFILNICLLSYMIAIINLFLPLSSLNGYITTLAYATTTLTILTLFICGSALVIKTKPYSTKNIKWIPIIYLYWILQTFISFIAFIKFISRRSRKWVKTEKTGTIITDNTERATDNSLSPPVPDF